MKASTQSETPAKNYPWRKPNLLQTPPDIGEVAKTLVSVIRNSLGSIKGAVYYLEQKYGHDETIARFLDIAMEEIDRMDNFVSRFFTTYTNGPYLVRGDINSLVRKLLVLTSFQMKSSLVECVSTYDDIPPCRFNPVEIGQAILNVLNSAIDSMPSGGRLAVATKMEKLFGENFTVITVSAYPIESQSASFKGNGLRDERQIALWITKKIIERHRGTLFIEPVKGFESNVHLCIPSSGLKEKNGQFDKKWEGTDS